MSQAHPTDRPASALPEWSTTDEVAQRYRTVSSTVRYWVHCNKIKGVRVGRRTLFHRAELERFERALLDQA